DDEDHNPEPDRARHREPPDGGPSTHGTDARASGAAVFGGMGHCAQSGKTPSDVGWASGYRSGRTAMTDRAALRKRGEAMRHALFGVRESDDVLAKPTAGFDDLMAELVYGSIWSRPGLGRSERMACTLAALCAVQNLDALASHIGAALHVGLSPNAIVEIFVQDGIYRGFPASAAALAVAQDGVTKRGVAVDGDPAPEAALAAPVS